MPSPTERINGLSELTATLTERLDGVRREVDAINGKIQKIEDGLHSVKPNLAVIEERLSELKKGVEEAGRRRWAIVPALVGAIIGGLISFGMQVVLRLYVPDKQSGSATKVEIQAEAPRPSAGKPGSSTSP